MSLVRATLNKLKTCLESLMKKLSENTTVTPPETLTIAITGEIAERHDDICELLSKLHELNCQKLNICFLLLSTFEHGRLIPLLTKFCSKGIVFNKVTMAKPNQLLAVTKVFNPDIIMTTDNEFAEQCSSNQLPVVILDEQQSKRTLSDKIHFAFDGDAVLFCHNAQLVADENGINAFDEHEERFAEKEMGKGTLFNFIRKIDILQKANNKVKWSLVTARGGRALKRAIYTIEQWNLNPSQCFFMEGSDKTPILKVINSDMFFDDHPNHCKRASGHMLVGHVQVSLENKV